MGLIDTAPFRRRNRFNQELTTHGRQTKAGHNGPPGELKTKPSQPIQSPRIELILSLDRYVFAKVNVKSIMDFNTEQKQKCDL